MHPLAHILTGALAGQLTGTPGAAVLAGFASHHALDAIPHVDAGSFRQREDGASVGGRNEKALRSLAGLAEAGLELVAGALAVGWLLRACPGAQGLPAVAGAIGALVPDLVDQPLALLGRNPVLHVRRWHFRLPARHAALGIATQVAVIAVAAAGLWALAGCRR